MWRAGLIGAECTGKSSVAAALARDLGVIHVPEALRSFVETRGRVPEAADQAGIMSEQRASVEMAHLDHPDSVIICDPLPLGQLRDFLDSLPQLRQMHLVSTGARGPAGPAP